MVNFKNNLNVTKISNKEQYMKHINVIFKLLFSSPPLEMTQQNSIKGGHAQLKPQP